ncbi:DUF2927 domain-containing protein [Oscillatoria sp. FACHB-1407]|uniref:DUF2927 domain-containing protein n=1 Tax=Oscillatoria sp. FACHB-1407 TaxID=2692847 RepID=UPI0016857390|nr:DUF2927 domain-containing protein [Oscillatoria sp. FACHB-1407]MBD2462107.1 DUF2927 domain-containing protein [Oscillatoria sp. FACHB-1407]
MHLKSRWAILLVTVASSLLNLGIPLSASAQEAVLTARDPRSEINVRTAPSTQAASPAFGLVGDRVVVLGQTQGRDGYRWYQVRFAGSEVEGWIRGDFVTLVTSTPSNPVSRPPSSAAAQPDRPTTGYSQEQINYFLELALGSEFGDSSGVVRKWQGDVRIQYFGTPTQEDRRTLEMVIAEVNALTHGTIRLQLVDSRPNVEIYFVPESSFSRYEPNYRPRNLGFFWTWWNDDSILDRARILISTDGVNQRERSHLIREELTQSLGLMRDSHRYQNSVFYQGWTDVIQYSDLDETVISMLYRPEIRPGMTRSQVVAALTNLRLAQQRPPSGMRDRLPLDFSLPTISLVSDD